MALMAERELAKLVDNVLQLTLEAGRGILPIYESDFSVATKQDESPLTVADLASHDALVSGLEALKSGFPILSEEGASIPFSERSRWETYWLIDPLTVNVALVHRHRPVLGVVYAPVPDRCFHAARGLGAFARTGQGAASPIRVSSRIHSPMRVVGSRSHSTPEFTRFLGGLGDCELISIGSSLKFCLIAEGSADLYPRLGPTSEWDTAAAQCVVEEAGGAVLTLEGEPLRYNTRESLLNPFFIVGGEAALERLPGSGGHGA
jgi:3'(2'), 5'-bisphosphate nucleotidase